MSPSRKSLCNYSSRARHTCTHTRTHTPRQIIEYHSRGRGCAITLVEQDIHAHAHTHTTHTHTHTHTYTHTHTHTHNSSNHCTSLSAIKRPRTRSAAARPVSNAHSWALLTGRAAGDLVRGRFIALSKKSLCNYSSRARVSYACTHTHVQARTHVHTHARTHTRTHAHTHTHSLSLSLSHTHTHRDTNSVL